MSKILDNALQGNTLNLRYYNLHDNNVLDIFENITFTSHIEKIDVRDNSLSSIGILSLLSKIKDTTKLKEFSAGYNIIGNKGTKPFFELLSSFPEIENIILNDGELDDASIMEFTNNFRNHTKLKHLDISSNKISLEGAKSLGEFLAQNQSLSSIYMSYNKIGIEGVEYLFKGISNNNSLKKIYLRNNDVKDAGLEVIARSLANNNAMESLNIGDNLISDEGIEKFCQLLAGSNNITSLNFGRNNIAEKGALAISNFIFKNHSLAHLNLGKNKIKDKGVEYLAEILKENTNLKIFNVRDNNISEAGAKSIGSMLNQNKGINILNICDNAIGNKGIEFIAEGLKQNNNVQFLYITNNDYSDLGVSVLAKLQKDYNINIIHFFDKTQYYEDAKPLKDHLENKYSRINILNETITVYDIDKLFKDSNHITTINIQGAGINAEIMDRIVETLPKTLLALNLSNNAIEEEEARILSLGLSKCPALEIIELKNNKLGRKGAKYIAQALEGRKLKFVDLSYNYVGFEFIEEISNYHKLDRLVWTF